MSLKQGDLKNTILKKISIDEYEPKTGKINEVMVIGFFVVQNISGQDLFLFINNSAIDIRDVEVSPNPNIDNYYIVFVEIDRNKDSIKVLIEILAEVEQVAGKLGWEIRSNLMNNYISINDDIETYIQTDPNNYLSKKKWNMKYNNNAINESILVFLKDTNILDANINENRLDISGAYDQITLDIVDFGNGHSVKEKLGIVESAIEQTFDRQYYAKLNDMLGELNAIPINEYVVIFNSKSQQMLVARQT